MPGGSADLSKLRADPSASVPPSCSLLRVCILGVSSPSWLRASHEFIWGFISIFRELTTNLDTLLRSKERSETHRPGTLERSENRVEHSENGEVLTH